MVYRGRCGRFPDIGLGGEWRDIRDDRWSAGFAVGTGLEVGEREMGAMSDRVSRYHAKFR